MVINHKYIILVYCLLLVLTLVKRQHQAIKNVHEES